jgi:hypothetical protein
MNPRFLPLPAQKCCWSSHQAERRFFAYSTDSTAIFNHYSDTDNDDALSLPMSSISD